MPRCQRTLRYLHGTTAPGAGVGMWVCPHCADNETYSTVRDPDLLVYVALAQSVTATDFGTASDPKTPVLLLWGTRPECVYEPADRRYDIYLASGSDPWQARLQIGHEIFHRTAGEGRVFHGAHEMLACLFSVRLLRRSGLSDYAERIVAAYRHEAALCAPETLFAAAPWSDAAYPAGYYGRAYVTGVALEAAAGYPALCRLARTLTPAGVPDIAGWLDSLAPETRHAVHGILDT